MKNLIYLSFCLLFSAEINCSKTDRRPAPLAAVDGYEPSSDEGVIRSPKRWVNFPSSTSSSDSDYSDYSDDSDGSPRNLVSLGQYRKSRGMAIKKDYDFLRAFNDFIIGASLLAIVFCGISIAESGASKSSR